MTNPIRARGIALIVVGIALLLVFRGRSLGIIAAAVLLIIGFITLRQTRQ